MDFNTKEDPDVIILDDEECPFTIVTVKIGEDGAVEETNEPVIKLAPPIPSTHYEQVQQVDDSDQTDNSDDWTEDVELPANDAPKRRKTDKKKQKYQDPLTCPYCGKIFNYRHVLNAHVMIHTGEKPYKCSVCNKRFIQKTNWNTHLELHHPSEAQRLKTRKITHPLNCQDCEISFTTANDYKKHMQTHTNAKKHKQSSSFQLEGPSKVVISSDSEAADIAYTCVFCDREFPDEESLTSHTAFHTGLQSPNSFTCKDDPPDVHSGQRRDQEIDGHLDQDSAEVLICKYCGQRCSTRLILFYHERTHRKKFRCPFCKRGFDNKQAYNRHLEVHSAKPALQQTSESSGQILKVLSCQYCAKQFDSKLTLSYHERTHKIKRKFRCSVCRRGYDNKVSYERHVRSHLVKPAVKTEHQIEQTEKNTNEQSQKSLKCKYCGKLCATERILSYHERTHSIQRNYHCSICQRGFNLRHKYYNHMKMHTAKPTVTTEHQRVDDTHEDSTVKPLHCQYCGKYCPTELTLSYHERSHKIKRTFRCSFCRRGFNSKVKYDKHLRLHLQPLKTNEDNEDSAHGTRQSYQCKYCGMEFVKRVSWSYHERSHKIQRKFYCSNCRRGFDAKHVYDRHLRECGRPAVQIRPEKTSENSLQTSVSLNCKYCGKYCKTKVSLSHHERTHKIKRSFRCFVCRRGFDSAMAFDRHVRMHRNGKESLEQSLPLQSTKPYSCKVCGLRFITEQRLSDHEETHRSKWEFSCSMCNKGFNRQQTYERHIMHCTKAEKQETDEESPPQSPGSFTCKYCRKQFNTKASLMHHISTHKIQQKFHCSECNQGFDNSQDYFQHWKEHFSTTNAEATGVLKPSRCNMCGLWFSSAAAFATHLKTHNTDMPYDCSVCKEKFKYPSHLISHMKIHNEPFSCSICDSTFVRREALDVHMARVHTAGSLKPFSCKDCGKGFMNRRNLFHHERAHKMKRQEFNQGDEYDQYLRAHSPKTDAKTGQESVKKRNEEDGAQQSQQSFNCNICGKHFSSKLSLKFHVGRHKIKYSFPCSVCHKRFSKKTTYEEHMRKHVDSSEESPLDQLSDEEIESNSGEIIFSCPHCDKELPTEQALKAHMNNHEKNDRLKPFCCKMCDARFEEKKWLDSHMEIHNLDRTSMFSCNICYQRFVTYPKYERHMISHRKERRHRCTVCNRLFSRRCKLLKHAKSHAEGNPFSCSVALQREAVDSAVIRQILPREGERKASPSDEDCEKRDSSKVDLEDHNKTHLQGTIKRKYRCSVCNKQFNKRLAYELHIKLHRPKLDFETEQQEVDSGEVSAGFNCEDRVAKVTTDESSDSHKKTPQRNYAFYCSICNRGFEQSDVYELHMKALHPGRIETEQEKVECVEMPSSETDTVQ